MGRAVPGAKVIAMNEVFGRKLGQYILLEQLGEGGMAKVYNALDTRAESNVAIKVILPSKRASSIFLQQFEREAKALANLTHTNIVKVLNYGIQDGQPYLVMEYVPGGTLKEVMTHKLPWQTAAAILTPIARALDYVHRQQIVHRDVKPSNILMHEDFRPMLSDFGILKILEGKEEKVESAIGAGIGTPEYMPPEQGMGREVDFRADIYSLGLVFYEMITGQKPFTADSPMAIVIKHVTDELPLPTRIDKNIPKYVERVILRAVQKEPRNRYISMGHFADALELIALGDKAPSQKINRISREREKRLKSFSIVSLSILLVVLILGTSLFAYNYFLRSRQTAMLPTAGPVIVQATTTAVPSPTPTVAATPTASDQPTPVPVPSAASSLSLLGTPIVTAQNATPREIARWGIGGVNVVRWSPDGRTIALGTTSGIFLYDAQSKASKLFIDTQFNVLALSFNPAGDQITAGSPDGIVNSWNSTTGAFVQSFNYTRPPSETITNNTAVTAILYSVDGHLAVGYKNGAINYFSIDRNTADQYYENYPAVEDLAISPDGRYIYAGNGSRDVFAWDISAGKQSETLINPTPIKRLRLSNDQKWLLTGGDASSVYLWDISEITPRHVTSFSNLGGAVTGFDFSHNDQYVAIGLSSGEIRIFAMPAGREEYSKTHVPLKIIEGYDEQVLSIASAPDQLVVASGNHEEGLKLWDIQSGENTFSLDASLRAIEEIHFSADGNWLASAHTGGLLRIWDVNQAMEAHPPFERSSLPKGVPFSPDNRYLAYVYALENRRGDVIRVVELRSGKVVTELPGFTNTMFVQFSDDSKLLVMGDAYTASIWDVATWEQVDIKGGPTAGCGQYSTPQSDLLAIISGAGIMFHEYDAKIQEMCGVKPLGAKLMYYFYQSHRMLFVRGNEKGDLWIWTSNTADLGRFRSNTPYPTPGKIFLAGDQASGLYAYVANGRILIKNISGSTVATIDRQDDYQYRVALLPDKKLMALGSRYGSIHIWVLP